MSRRIYSNPPIDEATCQFTLAEQLPWDDATPGRLFGELRDDYPGLPSQQQLLQANVGGPAPGGGMPDLGIVGNVRFVFADSENINRLSVSRSTISVHRARPYRGFKNELLVRIRRDLPRIIALIGREDIKGISVRYINRIVIPEAIFDLSSYFDYWGADNGLPEPFSERTAGFFYRTNALSNEQPENLTVTFGSVDSNTDTGTFVLDIDLSHNFEQAVKTDEAIDQMVIIQASANAIFESLITDKCRELFE